MADKKSNAKKPDSVQTKKKVSSEDSSSSTSSNSNNTGRIIAIVVAVLLVLCILCFCGFMFLGMVSDPGTSNLDIDSPSEIDGSSVDDSVDSSNMIYYDINQQEEIGNWVVNVSRIEIKNSSSLKVVLSVTNNNDTSERLFTLTSFTLVNQTADNPLDAFHNRDGDLGQSALDTNFQPGETVEGNLSYKIDPEVAIDDLALEFNPNFEFENSVLIEF